MLHSFLFQIVQSMGQSLYFRPIMTLRVDSKSIFHFTYFCSFSFSPYNLVAYGYDTDVEGCDKSTNRRSQPRRLRLVCPFAVGVCVEG